MKADKSAKGGKSMFDLTNVFQKSEDAPLEAVVQPVVTSVIVNGEVHPDIIDLLKAEGFDTEDVATENGVTVFTQDVEFEGDVDIVKLSDTIAMTVGVMKADGAFAQRCAERGFYPSVSIATDLLQGELYRAIEKSDSPSAASEKVGSIVSEFGTYLSSLIGSLPTTVFKAEEAIAKADLTTPVEKDDEPVKDDAKKDDDDQPIDTGITKSEDDNVDDDNDNSDDAGTKVEKTDEPIDIASIITQVTKGVTDAIAPTLTDLSGKIEAMGDRVDEAVDVAKNADETVRNSVFGGFSSDDPAPSKTAKSEDDSLPLLDTGFGGFGRER